MTKRRPPPQPPRQPAPFADETAAVDEERSKAARERVARSEAPRLKSRPGWSTACTPKVGSAYIPRSGT